MSIDSHSPPAPGLDEETAAAMLAFVQQEDFDAIFPLLDENIVWEVRDEHGNVAVFEGRDAVVGALRKVRTATPFDVLEVEAGEAEVGGFSFSDSYRSLPINVVTKGFAGPCEGKQGSAPTIMYGDQGTIARFGTVLPSDFGL